MKNFVSPHIHQKSLDSASTIATFIAREKELDTGHSVVTDHGTLAACKDVYDQSRAAGLQPILGLEAYHRDDDCPILLAANVPRQEETVCVRCGDAWKADGPRCEHDRADGLRRKTFRETWYKYGHLTMHFRKYAAYQAAVRILTKADLHAERHGGERKPIFSWRDLEEIAAGGATFGSSCLIGMVQRHLLTKNSPEMAERYYDRLRSIVGAENWFVEIFPHRARSNWVKSVFLVATSGQKLKYHFEKWVRTDRGEMSALDLAEAWARKGCQHRRLVAIKNRQTWAEVADFELQSVEAIEGFLDNEPCSWAQDGDVQRGCNQFVLELARRRGDRILVSDDSHFAHPEEKPVQDIRLGQHGAWRFAESYHRMGSDEALGVLRDTLDIREAEFEGWVENSRQWASGFKDFRFPSAPLLPTAFYPGDTVDRTSELIARHGRMQWDKPEYVRRLAYEISLFSKARVKDSDGNKVELDMLPYFFPIEEICREYAARGELTGPGRGSAAGTLLAYLLGITHADPIRYKLSIDRFLSKDSGKLPDIDQDLPDRSWLLEPGGWMEKRFGACFAQVSTDTLLKLKSSIKDVHRALYGRVHPEIEETTKRIEEPPQGVSDYNYVFGYGDGDSWVPGAIETDPALKAYSQRYPREWALVVKLLGLARNKSRHPCAHIIMNQPVGEVIPMTRVKDHLVTQYTADSVQAVGAVKYDLLGLKALLNLSHAIRWIHERAATKPPEEGLHLDGKFVPKHRLVPLGDRWADIWDLPDDQDVYDDIAAGRTETVFQFNTSGAKKWLRYFNHKAPDGRSIMRDIDGPTIFTALDRPGPLDAYVMNPDDGTKHNMLVEYSRRARGLKPSPDIPEVVSKLMPETHGIMVFQEQLQYAYQEITGCSGSEADAFRRDIAKKKMDKILAKYDSFVERGAKLLGSKDGARQVWDMFKTFGQYGFNRSLDAETILRAWDGSSKSIKDFRPGDVIAGVSDRGAIVPVEVVAVHDHGTLPGWEVEFDDGYRVITSIDHKFLTPIGQQPLWQILQSSLEVFADGPLQAPGHTDEVRPEGMVRYSKGTSPDLFVLLGSIAQVPSSSNRTGDEVRCQDSEAGSRRSSPVVREVHRDQEGEHRGEDAQAQQQARATGGNFCCGEENVSATGLAVGEGWTDAGLAERSPRGGGSKPREGEAISQEVQSGGVDGHPLSGVETSREDFLRDDSQGDRLPIAGREGLGRGGRVLALFRSQEPRSAAESTGRSTGRSEGSRLRTQCGSQATGRCDADTDGGELLRLVVGQDQGRLAGVAYSDAPLADSGRLLRRRVVRVRPVGPRRMYDLEVSHPKHNFLLPNGVVTSNSHSLCYSLIGYGCAYLKRHFPLEWWTAVLANAEGDEKEKIAEIYWPHVAHLILMPDVQLSGDSFRIEGDRIRAPLRLIVGVGEAAHAELIAGRPYSSIEDFVDKISSRRKASAKQTTSADGEQKERLGTTSLNRGVVTKLIVTGVMDSLFPAGLATYQKLEAYERALAKSQSALTGKKVQPQTIDTKYLSMDAIARFQRIKQVLPVYSAPLIPLLPPDVVEESGGRQVLALGGDRLVFATRQELSLAESISPLPEPLEVAVAAYVQAARPFTYNSKSERNPGSQEACELVLDMDGGRWSGVYWGRRKSAAAIRPGSILALALVRSKEDRGFSIADWWIVREPLADDAAAEKTPSSEPKVYSTKLGAPPDAVDVTRAGPWGNPHSHMEGTKAKSKTMTVEQAVRAFEEGFWSSPMAQRIGELTGKNLACACPPKGGWGAHHLGGYRCHGQVLLRLANPGIGTPAATSDGWNIYSGSTDGDGIAAALTNPTELSFRRGATRHKYPVQFRGQSWPDAEAAYQAAKGPGIDRDDIMVEIICQKLLLYPHLAGAIRAMGGTPFLRKCRHETGARSASARRWEGAGESSRFIRNLIAAYERAERVTAGLATSPA